MIGRSNWIFLLDGFSGEEGRLSRLSPVSNNTRLMAKILTVMGKTERAIGGHKLKLKGSMRLSIKGKLKKGGSDMSDVTESEPQNHVEDSNSETSVEADKHYSVLEREFYNQRHDTYDNCK